MGYRQMKSATIPSLRVDPELRSAAESILHQHETLSSFVIQSLRNGVTHRKNQMEFIARGLASRDEARKTGKYFEVDDVLNELNTRPRDPILESNFLRTVLKSGKFKGI